MLLITSLDVWKCQKVKAEHRHPSGLLQSLPIPEKKWELITMDFITGLPRTNKQHDSIMVVVDKGCSFCACEDNAYNN
jgi:hypothetical protein